MYIMYIIPKILLKPLNFEQLYFVNGLTKVKNFNVKIREKKTLFIYATIINIRKNQIFIQL